MPSRPRFEIGLTLGGAVSAGAYSAGVLDFLLEALDAIADLRSGRKSPRDLSAGLRDETPAFDPPHDASIGALSGTSAGGMVAAILASAFRGRMPPVSSTDRPTSAGVATGNTLYDSWVRDIHFTSLLGTRDLARNQPVRSLLDSSELSEITARALNVAWTVKDERPYLADPLPLYLCVGNMRGVRYSLRLDGAAGRDHQMSMHADHVAFCFSRQGQPFSLDGARPEPAVLLAPQVPPDNWKTLGTAALASGAFPVGLAPRVLERDFADYVERSWFDAGAARPPERRTVGGKPAVPADDPASWLSRSGRFVHVPPVDAPADFPAGRYAFVNVDGGAFNNEPLELCRLALAKGEAANPRAPAEATRAVVLIDPFPNLFELDPAYDPGSESEMLTVLGRLLGAFISQGRFKADELALALDPDVASRFVVAPVRYAAEGDVEPALHAIACGALGGFGGFLSRAFRHHDFMLGRRNCQRFLARHFVLPAEEGGPFNPLFAGWTDPGRRAAFAVPKKMKVGGRLRDVVHLPIVPLLGKLASPDYTRMPSWPAAPEDLTLRELHAALRRRADAVKDALIRQYRPGAVLAGALSLAWDAGRDGWIDRFAIRRVVSNLRSMGITLRP